MLSLMCPNCRHRFPAPGCCNPNFQTEQSTMQTTDCSSYYTSGLLVPRGYNNTGGCFINAPTIINGPTIIQSNGQIGAKIETNQASFTEQIITGKISKSNSDYHISTTTCDLTGGTVTITTPSIQSGGCLIQTKDSRFLAQAPSIEIRPQMSGSGCRVQKKHFSQDLTSENILTDFNCFENQQFNVNEREEICVIHTPSGCQELPGIRRNSTIKTPTSCPQFSQENIKKPCQNINCLNENDKHFSTNSCTAMKTNCCLEDEELLSSQDNSVQIQVNATVQFPPNIGQCTVNITATTTNPRKTSEAGVSSCNNRIRGASLRNRNNFNGGGLVQMEDNSMGPIFCENERRDDTPTTPVSWLTPCPWGFDTDIQNKDYSKLTDIKRLLDTSGWYHEGLSWQQSESLLKDSPIGRWLMRDSSDNRYTFAVSVQTARGPTSVRVVWIFGKFRLDAEPGMAMNMPLFDCPIKMLEFYVDYSKRNDEKPHVWIDSSGQIYSQIYLSQPLTKEVRSLSHLARLAINKNKLNIDHLPSPIRNYVNEYPYTF